MMPITFRYRAVPTAVPGISTMKRWLTAAWYLSREPRTSDDGTLYISYDSAAKKFYLSHTGFGSGNAYVWQAPNPTQGQWGMPVKVSVGGGSSGAALDSGEAYLDNFEMATGNASSAGRLSVVVPKDNFNDNRRGSMWRTDLRTIREVWLTEDANVLNVRVFRMG